MTGWMPPHLGLTDTLSSGLPCLEHMLFVEIEAAHTWLAGRTPLSLWHHYGCANLNSARHCGEWHVADAKSKDRLYDHFLLFFYNVTVRPFVIGKGLLVKLKEAWLTLDSRTSLFAMRTVEHRNSFPREFIDAPSLKIFKVKLDRALSKLM